MRRRYRQNPVTLELIEVCGDTITVSGSPRVIGDIEPFVTEDGVRIKGRRSLREYMNATGKVPVAEHDNVMKDHRRRQEYRREAEKRERVRDLVNVVKGYGL